jgi:hypothetical protein
MSQTVALTRPFLEMGYAVIAPRTPGVGPNPAAPARA